MICKFCNNTFLNYKSLQHHQKNAKYCIDKQKDHKCSGCGIGFISQTELIRHDIKG